jgi:acyl-CoA thioesterase FadM
MNLYLRMLWVYLVSLGRPRLPLLGAVSTLRLMTFPNDIDINRHVNNSRFLAYADLSRLDLFIRTGFLSAAIRNGWVPIIAEHTMVYRKPLKIFQRFDAEMVFQSYDEKYFHMTHTFRVGDTVIAEGTSKAVVRGRTGVLSPQRVLEDLHRPRG